MRRIALWGFSFAVACLLCVGVWWLLREGSPPAGPLPVPVGETTQQTFPDAEGKPEVWTLTRREAPREELVEPALPAPAPRESPRTRGRTRRARSTPGRSRRGSAAISGRRSISSRPPSRRTPRTGSRGPTTAVCCCSWPTSGRPVPNSSAPLSSPPRSRASGWTSSYFTHCGYTDAEVIAGWEELRDWVYGGSQPTVEDIQGRCLDVVSPLSPGPCRYDPDFVIPNMDERTPPR